MTESILLEVKKYQMLLGVIKVLFNSSRLCKYYQALVTDIPLTERQSIRDDCISLRYLVQVTIQSVFSLDQNVVLCAPWQ